MLLNNEGESGGGWGVKRFLESGKDGILVRAYDVVELTKSILVRTYHERYTSQKVFWYVRTMLWS